MGEWRCGGMGEWRHGGMGEWGNEDMKFQRLRQ